MSFKTGQQIIAVMPGTRFQQRVQVDDKWYVVTDLSMPKFEIDEDAENSCVVESDRPVTDCHLVRFEIELYVPINRSAQA